MILNTERLVLRPWNVADAENLYTYAKDDRIGPSAGWLPHKSIEESAEIIRTIFSGEGIYAVTLKEDDKAIGCVGLTCGVKSNLEIGEDEGEVSYWIGVPYWGKGLIPEAVRELIRYGFEDLQLRNIWCEYFVENAKSKRAQEKCGFRHHHIETGRFFDLINETRTVCVSRITREEWLESANSGEK